MPLSFLPDAETITPEVLVDVSNAVPTLRGYAGFPSATSAGLAAVSEAVTGGALCITLDGTAVLFVGTNDTLQKAGTSTWTDVSDTSYATGYNASTARWRFVQFGNTTLAIADGIQLQKYTVGDTDFAKVANAPKAVCMETAAGFVMLANCDDTSTGLSTAFGDQGHRWWCSQIFNPTGTWAPDVATQATSGLLVDSAGSITGLKRLGSDVVAFKKTAVHVGRYVGPPVVWQWVRVPGDVGCPVQEAAVSIGSAIVFIGDEDIYLFDGSRPVPIGTGIREWFFNRLNKSYADQISGTHDQTNSRVLWWYPSGGDGTLNSVLIYNYKSQKWGHTEITAQAVVTAQVSGVTYDNFGALGWTNYDDVPEIPYDSQLFAAGAPVPSYVDTSKVVQLLTGTAGDWSITTGDLGDPDSYSLLRRVRPRWRTKPTTSTLTHKYRADLGDTLTVLSPIDINGDRFDTLWSSRWHSWALSCSGDGEVEAFKPDLVPSGTE